MFVYILAVSTKNMLKITSFEFGKLSALVSWTLPESNSSINALNWGPSAWPSLPAQLQPVLFVVSALIPHYKRHLHPPSLPPSLLASQAEQDQGTTCTLLPLIQHKKRRGFSHSVTTIVRGLQLMLPRTVWENWHFLAGTREGRLRQDLRAVPHRGGWKEKKRCQEAIVTSWS